LPKSTPLHRRFHDGVANQDAAALASLYAEDGKFLPPGIGPCEGPAEIQSAMQQLLDMGARSLDVEPVEVREAGDLTIEYGRYTLGIEPRGRRARHTGREIRGGARAASRRLDEDRVRHVQREHSRLGIGRSARRPRKQPRPWRPRKDRNRPAIGLSPEQER